LAAWPVLPLAEQVTLPGRHTLDETVFDLLQLDTAERQAMRTAAVELVQTRLTRARSVGRGE